MKLRRVAKPHEMPVPFEIQAPECVLIGTDTYDDDWVVDENSGVTLNGHGPSPPVHIEKVKVIQAPADADVTVEVKLTATNINDGILPSTVIAGLLPIRIEPDDGMSGVIGGKVDSSKGEGGEDHFVTPKSTTAGDYVNLKATKLQEAWITPGDPNQLVEWDPAVGQSNGAVTKWKVKRDAAEKFPVKLRTIAKYGHEEAKKLNVWVTWATLELKDNTPKMQPSNDSGGTFTLNAKIAYKYTCQPNAMFDLAQDVPNFKLPPAPPAPGGNHPWALHKPLAEGAAIRYDATRQVRAVLKSSDSVFLDWQHQHEETPDIPNYPTDIAEGNDDPNIKGEGIPYQGDIDTQGMMQDVDSPFYTLDHTLGLPDATFLMQAQFRQYARVQIAGKWFQCSDLELSDLKFKFKKTNGKWTDDLDDPDDRSSFVKGNSTFPPP